MAGLTLDAGALIAAERGDRLLAALVERALMRERLVTIPTVALVEAWRGGRNARVSRLLEACRLEDLDVQLARAAGELLARTRTSDPVDAVVAQSAARRGDLVITSDPGHLQVLADELRTIRVWPI